MWGTQRSPSKMPDVGSRQYHRAEGEPVRLLVRANLLAQHCALYAAIAWNIVNLKGLDLGTWCKDTTRRELNAQLHG
jgi:hypothetical protein